MGVHCVHWEFIRRYYVLTTLYLLICQLTEKSNFVDYWPTASIKNIDKFLTFVKPVKTEIR